MKILSRKNIGIFVILLLLVIGVYIGFFQKNNTTLFPYGEEGSSYVENFFNTIVGGKDLTFVLFGIPGEQYNGGMLADSVIAIRLNEENRTIDMVSIPRDLWVWTGGEQFKLNEVFVREHVDEVIDEIADITQFDIDGYVVLSLSFVSDVIDSLGGILVTLDEPIVDSVSGFSLASGEHLLGGDDVLWLIRNRFHMQGDFFREHNQHAVIEGVFNRIKTLSDNEKQSLVKKFIFSRNDINIHISLSSLLKFIGSDVKHLSSYTIRGVVIDFSTQLFETINVPYDIREYETQTISALIPKEGLGNYSNIQEYIQEQLTK